MLIFHTTTGRGELDESVTHLRLLERKSRVKGGRKVSSLTRIKTWLRNCRGCMNRTSSYYRLGLHKAPWKGRRRTSWEILEVTEYYAC